MVGTAASADGGRRSKAAEGRAARDGCRLMFFAGRHPAGVFPAEGVRRPQKAAATRTIKASAQGCKFALCGSAEEGRKRRRAAWKSAGLWRVCKACPHTNAAPWITGRRTRRGTLKRPGGGVAKAVASDRQTWRVVSANGACVKLTAVRWHVD